MFKKKFILGVGFNDAPENLILEYIVKSVKNSSEKYYIVTPNPELLVIAHNNVKYRKVLNNAKLALPDGIGVVLASKLLGKGMERRITGVDLVNKLCKLVAEKPITVGFLGGKPGIADKTAECLTQNYPGLKVIFTSEDWVDAEVAQVSASQPHLSDDAHLKFFKKQRLPRSLSESLSKSLNQKTKTNSTAFSSSENGLLRSPSKVDILFVAFGSPKQEIWISENLNKLPVKVVIGVGGAFDFISGEVKRAPVWIRQIGLEWLFRLILQPWRIKRQLSLIYFIILILKEKFSS